MQGEIRVRFRRRSLSSKCLGNRASPTGLLATSLSAISIYSTPYSVVERRGRRTRLRWHITGPHPRSTGIFHMEHPPRATVLLCRCHGSWAGREAGSGRIGQDEGPEWEHQHRPITTSFRECAVAVLRVNFTLAATSRNVTSLGPHNGCVEVQQYSV